VPVPVLDPVRERVLIVRFIIESVDMIGDGADLVLRVRDDVDTVSCGKEGRLVFFDFLV
jgi:hypothetical protein